MAIDPKLIDDLNSRRKKVILSGGQEKIDKRHEKGEMTARDRMGYLFEEGTFSEIGMHVRHNCHNFGMGKKEIPGDGVVSGFGLVNAQYDPKEKILKWTPSRPLRLSPVTVQVRWKNPAVNMWQTATWQFGIEEQEMHFTPRNIVK